MTRLTCKSIKRVLLLNSWQWALALYKSIKMYSLIFNLCFHFYSFPHCFQGKISNFYTAHMMSSNYILWSISIHICSHREIARPLFLYTFTTQQKSMYVNPCHLSHTAQMHFTCQEPDVANVTLNYHDNETLTNAWDEPLLIILISDYVRPAQKRLTIKKTWITFTNQHDLKEHQFFPSISSGQSHPLMKNFFTALILIFMIIKHLWKHISLHLLREESFWNGLSSVLHYWIFFLNNYNLHQEQ